MRHFITALLAFGSTLSIPAADFRIGAHRFTLPPGFEIERVATSELVPRPIEADFDEQGRLYVTDSSGSNDKVEKQLAEKPHRVVRLEDTDGDGRFDKSITFADRMMLPQGALWFDGSLYVSAPPSIWKLTDTNSDGVADVRVEWFQGKTLTGCANDLHGPYAGPDGWIYWCKGAFAKQTYTLPNGKEFSTRASHIFRARADGTGVEPIMTGGMDNPVGLAFTPEGERIVSGTFFQNPEGGKRDGLIHAIYGGVYGKPNDALDGHPRTGELMPIMTHLGPAAPAGLMRYESDAFGKEFENNLFTACFNLHKVTRHVLEPSGASYRTRDEDFLVSDNTDFHPTDVLEDADGSIIVIDTGGWYKLCCPTSQLHKPDVLGGIYRVRRVGARKSGFARSAVSSSAPDPADLIRLLGANSPTQRQRAISELGKRGQAVVSSLATALRSDSLAVRQNAIWALTRIDSPEARTAVRGALTDRNASVRGAALHSVSLWRDAEAMQDLIGLLSNGDHGNRRLAAEAIGRLGYTNAVVDLISATAVKGGPLDRALDHSLIYALIDIGDARTITRWLNAPDPSMRRAALVALDQMPGTNLNADHVTPLLVSTNALLKETASWIVDHHPEWGESLAQFFRERLGSPPTDAGDRAELQQQLERLARNGAIQDLLVTTLGGGDPTAQEMALRALRRAAVKEMPASWVPPLIGCLQGSDPRLLAAAVATIRAIPAAKAHASELNVALLRVAERSDVPSGVRVSAAAAVSGGIRALNEPLYNHLLQTLVTDRPVNERGDAALALSRARLSDARLREIAAYAKRMGPMELPRVLPAFSQGTNEAVGFKLIESLQEAKALQSVRADILKPAITNYPLSVHERADQLLASLNLDATKQKAHLDELIRSSKNGDIRRGQALFNSERTACSACHAIGYLGGKVGPDLTRIGQVRNERDLLEAIVYPSASFVRSYEPMIVSTKGGEEYSGVLRKDALDEVVLATGPTTEQRISRDDVTDMRPGAVSVMPSGLAEQLTKEELADLMAFLKATRW